MKRKCRAFCTTFHQHGQKLKDQIDNLDDALWSEDEDPPFISEHGTKFLSVALSQFLNHPKFRAQIREIAQEEAMRIFALKKGKSFYKAAEDTLLDTRQICFKLTNTD